MTTSVSLINQIKRVLNRHSEDTASAKASGLEPSRADFFNAS